MELDDVQRQQIQRIIDRAVEDAIAVVVSGGWMNKWCDADTTQQLLGPALTPSLLRAMATDGRLTCGVHFTRTGTSERSQYLFNPAKVQEYLKTKPENRIA